MAGRKAEAQRDIIAEAADVWAVLIDVARSAKVLRTVDAVTTDGSGPFGPGYSWTENRAGSGKREQATMTVVDADAPRRLALAVADPSGEHRLEYVLLPSSVGTRLRVEVWDDQETKGFQRAASSLFGKMSVRLSKQTLDDDLADLARAAEDRVRR